MNKKKAIMKFRDISQSGLIDSSTISNCSLERINQGNFGLMCPTCNRIYSVAYQYNLYIRESSIPKDSTHTYGFPEVTIKAPDAIMAECPACESTLYPVNPNIATELRDWDSRFGFKEIKIGRPIAETGKSYANGDIEFCDDITEPHMQRLIRAIIQEFKDTPRRIKSYIRNFKTDEAIEITEFSDDVNRLIKTPESFISIWEDDSYDVDTQHTKNNLIMYLNRLSQVMAINSIPTDKE